MQSVFALTKKQAWSIVLLAMLVSVCVRAPQLGHAMGHHHESITALELLTIDSWKQGGGATNFNGIPLLNYQQPGDLRLPGSDGADKAGNQVYISYGTYWNLFPYYVFRWLPGKTSLLSLRLLNMCIGLLSCLLMFKLTALLTVRNTTKYTSAAIASIALMFTPGNLWYFSNVYVNCGVAIPLIIAFVYCLLQTIQETKKKISGIFALASLTLAIFLTDWIGCFLSAIAIIILAFNLKQNRCLLSPLLAIIAGNLTGILIFCWQTISYLGLDGVWQNLQGKFIYRSIHPNAGAAQYAKAIIIHFITTSFPGIAVLILCFLAAWLYRKRITLHNNEKLLFKLLLWAFVFYNIVFLSWTAVHEFSVLYYSVLLALAAGLLLPQAFTPTAQVIIFGLLPILGAAQFYLINPPGDNDLKGKPYNRYEKIGRSIARQTSADQVIFSNLDLLPPAMFYAKRLITYAESASVAEHLLTGFQSAEGVWIEVENGHIKQLILLHK